MSEKKKSLLSRAAVAIELKRLADDLDRGRLRIGAHEVAVEEPVFLKTKQKLKGEEAYFTISVKMPIAGEAPAEVPSREPVLGRKVRERPADETGTGDKRLKKEIGRLWKSVSGLIESEKMPDAAEIEGLRRRCEEYNLFAAREWQTDWTACTGLVQRCLASAAAGDWLAAKNLVADINRLAHTCHQKFKK